MTEMQVIAFVTMIFCLRASFLAIGQILESITQWDMKKEGIPIKLVTSSIWASFGTWSGMTMLLIVDTGSIPASTIPTLLTLSVVTFFIVFCFAYREAEKNQTTNEPG